MPAGQGVAKQNYLSHTCAFCKIKETSTPFKQCSGCKLFQYCSRTCQSKHWNKHKTVCKELQHFNEQNVWKRDFDKGTYACHLSPRESVNVSRLVGKRCTVKCCLNGVVSVALWDTGAQVSIVSHEWIEKNLPNVNVNSVESLVDCNNLDLKTANGTTLPFDGWVDLDFKLFGTNHNYGINVPFLVSKSPLDLPIIGYNVIEEITQSATHANKQDSYVEVLSSCMVGIKRDNVEALVNFIKAEKPCVLSVLKTTKRDITIPPNQETRISCHANIGPIEKVLPVLFEPELECPKASGLEISETLTTVSRGSRVNICVSNPTNHSITLPKRTVLGKIQLVRSVTPLQVKQVEPTEMNQGGEETESCKGEGKIKRTNVSTEEVGCQYPDPWICPSFE